MKKSVELRKEYEELKNSIANLKADNKIEEAHSKLKDLKELENKIREIEVEENLNKEIGGMEKMENKEMNLNRIFNRVLLGKEITEEERAFLNAAGTPGQVESIDEKGGYLVPAEQFTQIKELRRNIKSLKSLCNVISVNVFKGNYPIEKEGTGKLIAFDELNEINKSNVDFGQVTWNTADYGDIIPISNTLLADEKANITTYIGKRFTKKAINTENEKIYAILKTATEKNGTTYNTISTALNKDLDPAISENAIIVTNQSGFDWLDNLEDKNGRPLLTQDLSDSTKKLFKGRRVEVFSDTLIAPVPGSQIFYVGDMTEFITFFDREGLELAVSTEAGFTKNSTLIRAIERFDVKKVDDKAMISVKITPKA